VAWIPIWDHTELHCFFDTVLKTVMFIHVRRQNSLSDMLLGSFLWEYGYLAKLKLALPSATGLQEGQMLCAGRVHTANRNTGTTGTSS
jgi:hypothetical protein